MPARRKPTALKILHGDRPDRINDRAPIPPATDVRSGRLAVAGRCRGVGPSRARPDPPACPDQLGRRRVLAVLLGHGDRDGPHARRRPRRPVGPRRPRARSAPRFLRVAPARRRAARPRRPARAHAGRPRPNPGAGAGRPQGRGAALQPQSVKIVCGVNVTPGAYGTAGRGGSKVGKRSTLSDRGDPACAAHRPRPALRTGGKGKPSPWPRCCCSTTHRGLTRGVIAFADRLREAGHTVSH